MHSYISHCQRWRTKINSFLNKIYSLNTTCVVDSKLNRLNGEISLTANCIYDFGVCDSFAFTAHDTLNMLHQIYDNYQSPSIYMRARTNVQRRKHTLIRTTFLTQYTRTPNTEPLNQKTKRLNNIGVCECTLRNAFSTDFHDLKTVDSESEREEEKPKNNFFHFEVPIDERQKSKNHLKIAGKWNSRNRRLISINYFIGQFLMHELPTTTKRIWAMKRQQITMNLSRKFCESHELERQVTVDTFANWKLLDEDTTWLAPDWRWKHVDVANRKMGTNYILSPSHTHSFEQNKRNYGKRSCGWRVQYRFEIILFIRRRNHNQRRTELYRLTDVDRECATELNDIRSSHTHKQWAGRKCNLCAS